MNTYRLKTRLLFAAIAAFVPFAGMQAAPIDDLLPGHWHEVPNSRLDSVDPCPQRNCSYSGNLGVSSVIDAWSGGAYDSRRDRLIVWGGGHNSYAGNEVYVFDIESEQWSRASEPSTSIQTSVSHYSDGNPTSRHSYNDLQYDPVNDLFLSLNAAASYSPTAVNFTATDAFDFNTGRWTRMANRPGTAGTPQSAWSAIHPVTGIAYQHLPNGGRLQAFNAATNTWTSHVQTGTVPSGMTAAIDPTRNNLVVVGNNLFLVYDLSNPNAAPRRNISSGDSAPVQAFQLGFDYDATSDQFVAWTGGTEVYTLDPETFVWTRRGAASTNNVSPTTRNRNGTYGRFRYIPSKNAFILVNSTSQNVFYYKLSSGTGQPPPPPPLPPPPPPTGSDWEQRATATGVLMATRFDTEAEVTNWIAGSNGDHVSWDTSRAASGNGSLRFDILSTDFASSGNWSRWLSDDQREFTTGDEFYVQFRQYIPAFLSTHAFSGGGGWKQAIISRHASIMNGVNQPQPYGSNQLNEIVVQNTRHRGIVQGYNRDSAGRFPPWDVGASTACSGTDFIYQNAVDNGPQNIGTPCENDRARYGGLYSFYQQRPGGVPLGSPDPIGGAFAYYPNEWLTFLVRVRLGTYGGGVRDTHVQVYAARDGADYTLLIDRDDLDLGNGPTHDALWLLPYDTGRQPDSSRQDTFTLYDEVIVSTDFIPAPGGGTVGAVAPLPPSNFAVQ